MLKLDVLQPLVKKRKRIGRGGDRGGTSTKGHKGQNARSGGKVSRIAFEGGQMPLVRRLPKRGFNNKRFQDEIEIVNLQKLDNFFDAGVVVTKDELVLKGIIRTNRPFLLKILGDGTLSKKLIVHADSFSKSASEAIKKAGGEVHIIQES